MPNNRAPLHVEAFRVDVARVAMGIAFAMAVVVAALTQAGLTVVPRAHHFNNIAFATVCAALLLASWARPAWTRALAVVFFVALFALLAACCALVRDDPWRFGWLFPAVGAAYLILARRGGILWSIGAVCVVLREGSVESIPSVAAVTLIGSLIATAVVFGSFSRRATVAVDTLADAANHDALTGLLNRRAFDVALGRALSGPAPFALVLLDLDRFKTINDTFGHAAGDAVLIGVARALAGTVRAGDAVARIGGEEFAVILPGVDEGGALEIAERIRSAVERTSFVVGIVTTSVGIAASKPPHGSADAVFRRADAALYASKGGGRNRVVALPAAAE